jgi:protein-disulfide isomerase
MSAATVCASRFLEAAAWLIGGCTARLCYEHMQSKKEPVSGRRGMKMKLDMVVTATLIACAVITTVVVVRREFVAPAAVPRQVESKPILVSGWRDDLKKGVRLGADTAQVQLIEFADFECPYCSSFHKTLKVVRERYPTQVALIYVHFPLPMHRFAVPAARVAECAGEQGRFEAMHDRLYEGQDSLGLKPWSDYATAAGVPDVAQFDACIRRSDPIPRVEEGKQLGTQIDVKGTPTLVINGWKLGHPPTEQELDAMVKAVLAGKSPVDGET